MMEKCFDIGTIQAFLDGELAPDSSARVASHVAVCDSCAAALSEAEEETAFAFAALEQEFNTLVPTNRLWTKINDSIENGKDKTIGQRIFANFRFLFANPSLAAFAGLLIVAGLFAFLWNARTPTNESENFVARQNESTKLEVVSPPKPSEPAILPVRKDFENSAVVAAKNAASTDKANDFRTVKADFVKSDKAKIINDENRQPSKRVSPDRAPPKIVSSEYVSGEESYIKTIAALEKTIDSRKDEVLKPAARFSFEKDLAIADDAIDRMKSEVKKNPNNEAAKQILLASYQNKVELLNSVAGKNELIASLR